MVLRALIDLAPYFAIAALCLGIIAAWVLRSDANRKHIQQEIDRLIPGTKIGRDKKLPDRVSAAFLVALTACLFLAFAAVSVNTIVENGRLRQTVISQEESMVKKALASRASEKESRQLRARIDELDAQGALYKATIETLMKREDVSRATSSR